MSREAPGPDPTAQEGRRGRAPRIAIQTALTVLVLAWMTRGAWMPWPGTALVRDDHPAPGADAIILLMGSVPDRAAHAADLYRKGYARRIVFARPEDSAMARAGLIDNESLYARRFLLDHGVAAGDVDFLADTANTSTREEADAVLKHLARDMPGLTRVILVTSWYHSARAAWVFRAKAPAGVAVESSPAAPLKGSAARWWEEENTFLDVFNEWLKWVYYLTR